MYLLSMLLHEGDLVFQLIQHLYLWWFQTGPVGPELIQELEVEGKIFRTILNYLYSEWFRLRLLFLLFSPQVALEKH